MGTVPHRFLTKLERGVALTPEDRQAIAQLCSPPRQVQPRMDVFAEGDRLSSLVLVLDGWACRYRMLSNGNRQIIGVLLPGDMSQPFGGTSQTFSHSLMALSTLSICDVSPRALRALTRTNARIEDALWRDLFLDRDLASELIVSLGRRSATERLACFFCEIYSRLAAVKLVDRPVFDLPLTQIELADLLGLSSVHINRSLKELRRRNLVTWRGRCFTIVDLAELCDLAQFEPSYSLPQLAVPAEMAHGSD